MKKGMRSIPYIRSTSFVLWWFVLQIQIAFQRSNFVQLEKLFVLFFLHQYKDDTDLCQSQNYEEDSNANPPSRLSEFVLISPWLADADSTDDKRSQD